MPTLEAKQISKQFPAVLALDGVTITFEKGEVHGIVGENGAGKSTLMKVLSGVHPPSSGMLELDGRQLRLTSVRDAIGQGIVMIHQELNLVDELTVAENIFLGRERRKGIFLDRRWMADESRRYLEQVGAPFDPSTPVSQLSIAGKQLVEIAKAISYDARILIMDEPTAVLTEHETSALFKLIGQLKDRGVTVIYISHILSELLLICDRITVLRDGKLIDTVAARDATQSGLAKMMVGRELGELFPAKPEVPGGEPVLRVEKLTVPGFSQEVSFELRRGEVLGLAGLIGSGRTETAEAVAAIRRRSHGAIFKDGVQLRQSTPQDGIRHGIAYVSEDRKAAGLVLDMNTVANTTLANLGAYGSPFLDQRRERAAVQEWVRKLDVRVGDLDAPVLYLSGGNQQKVSVAKWLEVGPDVLILDEPTRGIDVGSKREMYNLISGLAAQGMACLVISSDMPELIGLCHRVLVMREGRVVGELSGDDLTEEKIMLLAAGVHES
ncbi:MAG TPA: sugar ABC transporter ATP-binding protein [Fimbriimonadaceae bacterium]|nr:sugar ABC transporter ATP-binding protein [Fimbriimonadaceae bacterium]